ncbi:MAG: peptidoglycan editing factor PgeF [Succinivibrio sp.]|nr:peptidoglycan editing factor PgeF [Succinivibrio sp.]
MVERSSFVTVDAFEDIPVKALYTTRFNGKSEGDFSSFNLGLHVEDDPKNVLQNRLALEKHLSKKVVFMNQTHSEKVVLVDKNDACECEKMLDGSVPVSLGVEADGIVTCDKSIALAVLTADCLPLLMTTKDGAVVAAVHCGWKGVYSNIIKNAVLLMREHSQSEIYAYLGPCIGPESFEVGTDLLDKFKSILEKAELAFTKKDNGKYLCSLPLLTRIQLEKVGVTKVVESNVDTYQNPDHLYSYRRAKRTGRMASVIASSL